MNEGGRILIADDEETFLHSTADLLRQRGYECNCATDAQMAIEMLKKDEYELLIADIKMPGNFDLELVHEMPQITDNLPIILVTGYPSVESAIQSIQLPVIAYLVKPVEFDNLLVQVQSGVNHFRIHRAVRSLRKRLQDWREGLSGIEDAISKASKFDSATSIGTFFDITFQNIAGALLDLNHLSKTLAIRQSGEEACHLLNCPRLNALTKGLAETIDVLRKSKTSFKSEELKELRIKLENLLKDKTDGGPNYK